MSKPRHDWWPYVKGMIRRYPALKAEHEALRGQSMTASYTGMPRGGGGGKSRPVEDAIQRGLSGNALREYQAVANAIRGTEVLSNGTDRLQVIRLVFWERSHTLEGAAMVVCCSAITAKRWHKDFIWDVAQNYGLAER